MMQRTALIGGAGVLMDQDGSDVDLGAPPATQPFNPQIQFFHPSQGFGCDAGLGMLRDTGRDRDSYPAGRRTAGTASRPPSRRRPASRRGAGSAYSRTTGARGKGVRHRD
jgi:hypothetical protein